MENKERLNVTLILFILLGFIAIAFLGAGIVFFYQQKEFWNVGLMSLSVVITVIYWLKSIFRLIDLIKKEEE